MLYLPAMWYHHVKQDRDTVAVNYWHDMNYYGPMFVFMQTIKYRAGGSNKTLKCIRREIEKESMVDSMNLFEKGLEE